MGESAARRDRLALAVWRRSNTTKKGWDLLMNTVEIALLPYPVAASP